jgi:hypothetical protein
MRPGKPHHFQTATTLTHPPHIIDQETVRQIKEGIASAGKRLTRQEISRAISEAARTASHPEMCSLFSGGSFWIPPD